MSWKDFGWAMAAAAVTIVIVFRVDGLRHTLTGQ